MQNKILVGSEYICAVCKEIDRARSAICILMFDWRWYGKDPHSDMQILNQAILQAARRGVSVRAITHLKSAKDILLQQKINVRSWHVAAVMHAKFLLIDDAIMVIGSHNLSTRAMTSNLEISLLIEDALTGAEMRRLFDTLWQSSM